MEAKLREEIVAKITTLKASMQEVDSYVRRTLGSPDYSYKRYRRLSKDVDDNRESLNELLSSNGFKGTSTLGMIYATGDEGIKMQYIK